MDRAQSRSLVVLSALVIAVAALLFFGGAPREDSDPEATAAVWTVDAEDAVAVRVERAAGVLRLEKDGSAWRIREPLDEAADPRRIDDLLSALGNVSRGVPVEVPAERAAEFGLGAPPNARVSVTLSDGTERHLDVGFEAPTGFRTYVRDASGGIAAASGDLNRSLLAEVDRFRDPRVVPLDPERVRGVVVPGTPPLVRAGDDWWLDGLGPADPDAVSALLGGLAELRYQSFGAPLPPEAADGGWEVRVEGGPPLRLRVGPATEDGLTVGGPDGRSGLVEVDALESLPHRAEDLLSASGLGVAVERTDRVEIRFDGRSVLAARNGGAWQSAGADDGDTWTWVAALARARPVARVAEESPAEVVLLVGHGDQDVKFELGPRRPDGTRAAHRVGVGWFSVESDPIDQVVSGL